MWQHQTLVPQRMGEMVACEEEGKEEQKDSFMSHSTLDIPRIAYKQLSGSGTLSLSTHAVIVVPELEYH